MSYSLLSRRRGFSIIELLVVMVILGLLITAATTNYVTAQRRARDNARKVQLNGLSSAIETYYAKNRNFPGKRTATLDGTASLATKYQNCEQIDGGAVGSQEYYYYYLPLDNTAVAGNTQSCNKRTGETNILSNPNYTYTPSDYSPYPSWIPGLGEFLSPIITDKRFNDKNGVSGIGATPLNYADFFNTGNDLAANNSRTYFYQRLQGGYLLLTRMESQIGDTETIDGNASPVSFTDKPTRYSGAAITITGKYLYMIRK